MSLKKCTAFHPGSLQGSATQEVLHVLVNDASFGAQGVGDIGHQCRTPVPGVKPRFVLGMRFSLRFTSWKAENAAEV